jgi:hypothetical protein
MIISGVSGNAAYDQQKRIPFMYNGHSLKLNYTTAIYQMDITQTSGGTLAASPMSGVNGTKFNLTATPQSNHHHLSTYGVSGATLTGSSGTYVNSDVSAKPAWYEDPKYTLTVQQGTGGTLIGSPTSGYSGDRFGLTATPSTTAYTFKNYSITGATLTGNSGTFKTSNVTAKANWQTKVVKVDYTVPSTARTLTFSADTFSRPRYWKYQSNLGSNKQYLPEKAQYASRFGNYDTSAKFSCIYLWPGWATERETYADESVTYTNTAIYNDPGQNLLLGDMTKPLFFGSGAQYFATGMSSIATSGVSSYYGSPVYFTFGNGGFISAFSANICLNLARTGTHFRYRVIRDGVTGSWSNQYNVTSQYANATANISLTANVISSTSPFKIEFSGYNENAATTSVYYYKPVSQLYSAGQSWTGKICHTEIVDV